MQVDWANPSIFFSDISDVKMRIHGLNRNTKESRHNMKVRLVVLGMQIA